MIPLLLSKAGQCWCQKISFLVGLIKLWSLKFCNVLQIQASFFPTSRWDPGSFVSTFFPPRPATEASALISEGYLKALVRDVSQLPIYWQHVLREFPSHPVKTRDCSLNKSIACTLYWTSTCQFSRVFWLFKRVRVYKVAEKKRIHETSFQHVGFWWLRRWDWSFGWQLDVPGMDEWSLAVSQQFHVQSLSNCYNSSVTIRFFGHRGHHYIGSCCKTHCTFLQLIVYLGHQSPFDGCIWSQSWPFVSNKRFFYNPWIWSPNLHGVSMFLVGNQQQNQTVTQGSPATLLCSWFSWWLESFETIV